MNIKYLLLPSPISGAKDTKQGSGLGRTLCLAALFVTFATAAWAADVVINSTNFPDATFRKFVTENFDTEKPKGSLSDAELQAVTTMDVSKKSIQNLKGIEYFTALNTLKCYGNKLTQLDVSALTNLVTLECYDNSSVMTTLNATGCTALKTLKCYNSKLEALSLGRCSNLATLDCHSNQLTELNISACVKLTSVSCYGNSIRGDKMVQFINSLPPKTSNTYLNLIYNEDASSGNEIMHAQVLAAKAKKWTVRRRVNSSWSAYAGIVAVDEATFPDPNFLAYVSQFNTDNDGILSEDELANVTEIRIPSKKINDLTGIECFEDLTYLSCSSNNLTSLDLSKNTKLETLSCYSNQLTSLDLSKNTELETLDCGSNQLTSLDLSNNQLLKNLYCYKNQLTSLDLSNIQVLEKLYCYNNELTSISLHNYTNLNHLECFQNHLQGEAVDNIISKLPQFKEGYYGYIYFYKKESPTQNKMTSEQLETIKAKNWNVKQYYYDGYDDLWVDYVPNHDGIYIDENAFPDEYFRWCVEDHDTDTDGYLSDDERAVKNIRLPSESYYYSIKSLQGIEYFPELEVLNCGYAQPTSLDLSGNPKLTKLTCNSSYLTSIDLSGNPLLTELTCYSILTSIDLSVCPLLKKLVFNGNFDSLDLSVCPLLTYVSVGGKIGSINVSNHTQLEQFYTNSGEITSIDLSGCSQLKKVSIIGNKLASINLSGCTQLEYFAANNNELTSLDLSDCKQLQNCFIPDNPLTSLKASDLPLLKQIELHNVQLTTLDLSNCTSLQYLNSLYGNPLTSINVSGCTSLISLNFSNMQLTSINVTGCTSINYVAIDMNRLQGEGMDAFVESMPVSPKPESAYFNCMSIFDLAEQNRLTPAQAAKLREKGWPVQAYYKPYGTRLDYDGYGNGDVDGSGTVDADDVRAVVNHILGLADTATDTDVEMVCARAMEESATPFYSPIVADTNGDGVVDIADVAQIISKVGTVIYEKPEK